MSGDRPQSVAAGPVQPSATVVVTVMGLDGKVKRTHGFREQKVQGIFTLLKVHGEGYLKDKDQITCTPGEHASAGEYVYHVIAAAGAQAGPPAGPGLPGEPPLPDEMMTSTQLINSWEIKGKIHRVNSLLSAQHLAEQAGLFKQWWRDKSGTINGESPHLRPIVNETTDGQECYKDFYASCVEPFVMALVVPGYSFTPFLNKAAENSGQPDVMGVLHGQGEEPQPENMWEEGCMVYEGKNDLQDPKQLNSGLAQVINRSRDMRQAKKQTSFVLAGGLFDNRSCVPVVVCNGPDGWLIRSKSCLRLLKRPQPGPSGATSSSSSAVPAANSRMPVDTTGDAYKELGFTVFVAVDLANLRAAADPRVSCLRPGQCVSVRSTSGEPLQVVIDSLLSRPGPSGCVYTVTVADASRSAASDRLVMKVAPPPVVARQAIALGRPLTAWTQVEREIHHRQRLGDGVCPGLPRTAFLGQLKLEQQAQEAAPGQHMQRHALHGAAAVVMEWCGEPLLVPGAQAYPQLAPAEVDALVRQLAVPLLYLQCRGITHLDVHARNMARMSPTTFGIMDLGTASTQEDWKQSGWRPPICLLYSCQELVAGKRPRPLADLQSLIFVAMVLGGLELPWARAAAEGDSLVAHAERLLFMERPGDLPGWAALFSAELRPVLERVLATALGSRSEQEKLVQSLAREWRPRASTWP